MAGEEINVRRDLSWIQVWSGLIDWLIFSNQLELRWDDALICAIFMLLPRTFRLLGRCLCVHRTRWRWLLLTRSKCSETAQRGWALLEVHLCSEEAALNVVRRVPFHVKLISISHSSLTAIHWQLFYYNGFVFTNPRGEFSTRVAKLMHWTYINIESSRKLEGILSLIKLQRLHDANMFESFQITCRMGVDLIPPDRSRNVGSENCNSVFR